MLLTAASIGGHWAIALSQKPTNAKFTIGLYIGCTLVALTLLMYPASINGKSLHQHYCQHSFYMLDRWFSAYEGFAISPPPRLCPGTPMGDCHPPDARFNLLLSNITFYDFCCFLSVTQYVTINTSINCSFFTFIIIIIVYFRLKVHRN